jgi:hypothetical protein
MKLIKYKQPKMADIDLDIDPNYNFVDVVDDENEIDITDFDTLSIFGVRTGYDFMFVRNEVITLRDLEGGFSGLTDEWKKEICAEFAACTEAQALSVLSVDKQKKHWKNTLNSLRESRETRVEKARQELGLEVLAGTMPITDSNQFYKDTKDLFRNYIGAGDIEFFDWINSTGAYIATGFASKSYYTDERKQILVDKIILGKI